MRDIPPAEFAGRQLDELLSNQKYELDRAHAVSQRWVLWLAIGNGAALAAIGAKLVETRSEALAALLMPSCWLFLVGLVAAGSVAPITLKRHQLSVQKWREWTVAFRKGQPLQSPAATIKADERLRGREVCLEWIAAASFVGGVAYPLIVMCHRYLTSGHGFFPPA
jgi:hypothetical protein